MFVIRQDHGIATAKLPLKKADLSGTHSKVGQATHTRKEFRACIRRIFIRPTVVTVWVSVVRVKVCDRLTPSSVKRSVGMIMFTRIVVLGLVHGQVARTDVFEVMFRMRY